MNEIYSWICISEKMKKHVYGQNVVTPWLQSTMQVLACHGKLTINTKKTVIQEFMFLIY